MKYFKATILIFISLINNIYASDNDSVFQIVCQPYLQNLSCTEATIVWVTNKDAVSWVEIAPNDSLDFYACSRPRFFDSQLGKRKIGKIHTVHITNLQPASSYRYRVFSQEVINNVERDVRYGQVVANNIHRKKPFVFSTPDERKEDIHFAVVNDIHEDTLRYKNLFHAIDSVNLDFMILNGDMVNKMNSVSQAIDGFLNTSSDLFAKSIPFYMVRGNHETRGNKSGVFMDIFPSSTQKSYYTFSRGSVFFIVLDGGEDKPDSDIEYCGLSDFDNFRTQEAEWLKNIASIEEYKKSKIRIVLMHVPPCGKTWHGMLEVQSKFLPILNNMDIDLMLCGHIHKNAFYDMKKTHYKFPILVNSNKNILDVKCSRHSIHIDMKNEVGKSEKQYQFNVK